jgi:hypothetical protein
MSEQMLSGVKINSKATLNGRKGRHGFTACVRTQHG